ncbi:MAG: amino acid racemase, partial [Bacteroidota bacterium]
MNIEELKRIGICAHSYEGGALCFLTACREGARLLGPHMHPNIVLSAIPMGLSMPAWESDNYEEIARHLTNGVKELEKSGADFFICPDNTGHIVLEKIINSLPLPGLHIADVVCQKILDYKWRKVGLLGTKWTMTGTVYSSAFTKNGLDRLIPNEDVRTKINQVIFDELCQGIFKPNTIDYFIRTIEDLKNMGAECVVLGCTEIPLIINKENSPLPILDSTRLLAQKAVQIV